MNIVTFHFDRFFTHFMSFAVILKHICIKRYYCNHFVTADCEKVLYICYI